MNSRVPTVHSNANFLGFTAKTGNKKTQSVKHATEPSMKQTKRMRRSDLESVNHEGSESC